MTNSAKRYNLLIEEESMTLQKFYISFGQVHAHSVNGHTFDKDSIAVIEAEDETAARKRAFEVFGPKWGFLYHELPNMDYFPRGLITLD